MTQTYGDLRFYLNDELEAVLRKVQRIEKMTKNNITQRKNQRKLLKALLKLETDIENVQQLLGEEL
jgi:hypothetical protein